MQLESYASDALDKWLGPSTWFKDHPNDTDRFYDFVDQYQKAHGYTIDESSLSDEIEYRITIRGGSVSEDLRDIIRDRVGLAFDILDFLKRTKR